VFSRAVRRGRNEFLSIFRQWAAIVHARCRESTARSEQQGKTATHAEPDNADLAGATILYCEPFADGFNFVKGPSPHLRAISGNRAQTTNFPAPREQVPCRSQETFSGQPIGLIPEIRFHSACVMDDDNAGPGAALSGRAT
jgi:hypothetical protein